ncbi:TIGR03084 family metal-binding protein [Rhodococcus sp. USK13]|uniref:TIGR03084 family metal-binding protein n=1 Tax=Rhodococcus sp. USK13 TaxID=2806442 RepID=UPI001BCAE010|nr:TIGR03084 family metal-binding protein [Rhodococcus sp. USK13]
MALDYEALLDDLDVETVRLVLILRGLTPDQWEVDTPADGWAVRDQVSHLAFFDDAARTAVEDPERFREESAALIAGGMDFPDRIARDLRTMSHRDLEEWFVRSRNALLETLRRTDPKARMPWYGPDMSAASSATARLMETWAHGRDIYDALGLRHQASPGLRSIAHLGVSTFAFAHQLNGLPVPDHPVRVVLQAPHPEASVWTWGPADAENSVVGSAEDFVLVVTQRRNVADTRLVVTGPVAHTWMGIAQAFAGAPGPGRPSLATPSTTGGTR